MAGQLIYDINNNKKVMIRCNYIYFATILRKYEYLFPLLINVPIIMPEQSVLMMNNASLFSRTSVTSMFIVQLIGSYRFISHIYIDLSI